MLAKWIPAVRTPITAAEAIAGFRAACKRLWNTDKPETVAVLTAQSALESARWAAMWAFNPSNIKCEATRQGLYCCIKLNEQLTRSGKLVYVWYDPGGELTAKNGTIVPGTESANPPGHPQTRMRAYETFADGVADKLAFLNKPRWAPAKAAALAGDPALYVQRCKDGNYFTADLAPYLRSTVSLFKTYLPLAQTQARAEPEPLPPEIEERLCVDMAECLRVEPPEWLEQRVKQIQALTAQQMYDDQAAERRRARDAAIREVGDGWDKDD